MDKYEPGDIPKSNGQYEWRTTIHRRSTLTSKTSQDIIKVIIKFKLKLTKLK